MILKKIGLAIAFSPTASAMLAEAGRLASLFDAKLVLIHAGTKTNDLEAKLDALCNQVLPPGVNVSVVWKEGGNPSDQILAACREEQIDLLVAGALKKEKLVQYYIGTVARKIMRKATCSVLLLTRPSDSPEGFKNIVVNAEDSPHIIPALQMSCLIATREHAGWLHVVRELKLFSLTLSASEDYSQEEYNEVRQKMMQQEIEKVEELLKEIPRGNVKINIKLVAGKSGFELARFASRKNADLLVVGAPPRRFNLFDRVFPHDHEYVFADLPCNLLMVNQPPS